MSELLHNQDLREWVKAQAIDLFYTPYTNFDQQIEILKLLNSIYIDEQFDKASTVQNLCRSCDCSCSDDLK